MNHARVVALGTASLAPHKDFILAAVANCSDITIPELAEKLVKAKGVKAVPSTLSKFLIGCGFSFKKKRFGQANKTGLIWPRHGLNGNKAVSPSCVNSAGG